MNVLSVLNLPANTLVNLSDSNQGPIQAIVKPEGGGGGGGVPLVNVVFADKGTTAPLPDGSIGAPFPTVQAAYAALAAEAFSGVVFLTPRNYTDGDLSAVDLNVTFAAYGAAWSSLENNNTCNLPPVTATGSAQRIGFQNVVLDGITDAGGSNAFSLDGCQVQSDLHGNLFDGSSLTVINSTFNASVDLRNFSLIEMDVPSFLSWQAASGTLSGSSPPITIRGVAACTLPYYFKGVLAGSVFLPAYGGPVGTEEVAQVPTPQPTRYCRLRLQCTIPLGGVPSNAATATLRFNGVDHPTLVVALNVGDTSAEVKDQFVVPAGTLISISLSGAADTGAGAIWASVDLYP